MEKENSVRDDWEAFVDDYNKETDENIMYNEMFLDKVKEIVSGGLPVAKFLNVFNFDEDTAMERPKETYERLLKFVEEEFNN